MEIKKAEFLEKNKEDRLWFIKYWANYVRTHDDKDWSRQQKILIDSQINNARKVKSREQFSKKPKLMLFQQSSERL